MGILRINEIDISGTSLSPLVADYLNGMESLRKFYLVNPAPDTIFNSLLNKPANKPGRELLAKVLAQQYSKVEQVLTNHPSVGNNISILTDEKTFTVTTGHQLNLFTGPLYFIYKVASTINLTKQLAAANPGYNFVPVYWMASEDHDLDEIDHCNIKGVHVQWEQTGAGAAGRLKIKNIEKIIEQLTQLLDNNEETSALMALLQTAYAEGRTLSEATRILVHELFGKYGLVILDPDSADLKKLFVEAMTDDISNHSAYKKVSETNSGLEELKYKPQVHPREINLFYLGENSRSRIEKQGEKYIVLDQDISFTHDEIISHIQKFPEQFSPNVVLRPLYQEIILPNAAVVGGPAEIAYWLEYRSMFEHYKVPFPALVLRGSAMVLEKSLLQRIDKLGFTPADVFKTSDTLIREYIQRDSGMEFIDQAKKEIEAAFLRLADQIASIDSTLVASADAEKQKTMKAIETLRDKGTRALKRKDEASAAQVEKIKSALFPGGVMQERHENFMHFYSRWGDRFIDFLVNEMNPLRNKMYFFME